MKTPWLAAFLAVLFGTTACAETFDDPSKEQEVNGSYSWTLSGDSTVKYVSSLQDNPGTLDIGAYTLNMANASGEEFWGTLEGGGTINMTLTSDGGYNFIGNGSSFTGTISVTGPEVFTLQRNLAGSVSIGSDTGFSIGMDNVSLDGALTLKDNSWYVVAANASGGAATLTAGGLNIGSGVRVAIGRTNPADYIWTNELKQGSYTIIETTDPINGKFEDGVYTEAGGFSDVNIGSPLVDASLDQQETKIVLNVSIKEEDVVLPGISSESNSLINAIKNGATPDSPLMSLVLGSTPSELQTFGKEMDTARGSISAASSMAVNTAAPASMARLDSLKEQRARLQELKASADNLSDLLQIESSLSDVQYQLESYQSPLDWYSRQVECCTVYLSLEEVQTYTPVEEGFGSRIQNALREGWSGFVETVQSAAVFLVGHWPFIVVGAVCGVIFYKARHPKHKKQK